MRLSRQPDALATLPKSEQPTEWTAGTAGKVAFGIWANHGGGYAYRMAPLDSALDEAAFGRMPLDFSGNSVLRWGGARRGTVRRAPRGTR